MVLGGENVLNGIGDKLGHFFLHVVQTRTQDDQVTSAPRAVNVSMRTAVWMVLHRYHGQCYCYCCTVSRHTCGDIQQYEHPSRAEQQRAMMKKAISGL